MTAVTLYPAPVNIMRFTQFIQSFPQIPVLDRLPTGILPAFNPLSDSLAHILGTGYSSFMLNRIVLHLRQTIVFHRAHRAQTAECLTPPPDWLDRVNGTDVFPGDNHVN